MNHNRYEDRLTLLNRNKYLKLMNLDDKSFVFNTYEYYKMYKKFTKDQYDKVKTLYYKLSETELCTKPIKKYMIHSKELYTLIQPLVKNHSIRQIVKILKDKHEIVIGKSSVSIIIKEMK